MTEVTRIGGHCGCGKGERLEDRWVCTGCPHAGPPDPVADLIQSRERLVRAEERAGVARHEHERTIEAMVEWAAATDLDDEEIEALIDVLHQAGAIRYGEYESWYRDRMSVPVAAPLPTPTKRGWGVYLLIDDRDVVFYVGMSGTPKNRLAKHRREFGDLIARVEWRPTEDRRSALDLETELIAELDPRMNIAKVTT
jgi:hypothetical protein